MEIAKNPEELSRRIFDIYEAHACPAEVVVPFRMTHMNNSWGRVRGFFRYMFALWNMDSPWIMSVIFAFGCNVLSALLIGVLSSIFGYGWWFGLMSTVAALMVPFIPVVYGVLVCANLFLGHGASWWQTIYAPTHLGLTDSGFKIYYRGGLFYNYPNLALWDDIKWVDVVKDGCFGGYALELCYETTVLNPRTFILPLQGFASEQDLKRVLNHFDKNLPLEKLRSGFCRLTCNNYNQALARYREIKGPPPLGDMLLSASDDELVSVYTKIEAMQVDESSLQPATENHAPNSETPDERTQSKRTQGEVNNEY